MKSYLQIALVGLCILAPLFAHKDGDPSLEPRAVTRTPLHPTPPARINPEAVPSARAPLPTSQRRDPMASVKTQASGIKFPPPGWTVDELVFVFGE